MANLYMIGGATAVSQETRCTPGSVEADDGFYLKINGVTIAQFISVTGTVAEVVAGLVSAWNASTNVYKTDIVASNVSNAYVKLLGPAGMPFTVVGSTIDGGGLNTQTLTIINQVLAKGPNDWGSAENWSGGAVPVNSDVVFLRDSSFDLLWGLDQSSVTLSGLYIDESFKGKIGINYVEYIKNATGTSIQANLKEYRPTHLKVKVNGPVEIGKRNTANAYAQTASPRILLDLDTQATTCTIWNALGIPSELGRAAIRLKANSASTDIVVMNAPNGVSIGAEVPGETVTLRTVNIADTTSNSQVMTENGVTLTRWLQNGGIGTLEAVGTVQQIEVSGGSLVTRGNFVAGLVANYGATLSVQHFNAASAIKALVMTKGITDLRKVPKSITIDSVEQSDAAVLYFVQGMANISNYTQQSQTGSSGSKGGPVFAE